MATIKIKRTTEWVNMGRNYKIFIDGQFVGKIASGATKEFQTTAGQHIVVAKIDWCSSPNISINVNSNETKYLKVGNFRHSGWLLLLMAGMIGLLPILRGFIGFDYAIIFPIPPLLLSVFYISFGRKKYLTISELNDV
jgi:hypothetical protein